MSARPWFPFYPADYQLDTLDLTFEQHGLYLTLLLLAWRRPDGALIEEELPKMLRALAADAHGNRLRTLLPSVLHRFFKKGEDGKWRQNRLEEEREKGAKLSRKQSEIALKRHAAEREINDLADANAVPLQSQSQHSTKKKEQDAAKAAAGAAPGLFEEPPKPVLVPPSPPTPEAELYRRGREVLGKAAGGVIKTLLKAKNGSIPEARAAIEIASTKGDSMEWLQRVIRNRHINGRLPDRKDPTSYYDGSI